MQWQPIEQVKIFANQIFDKGLVTKIHKLIQLIRKKKKIKQSNFKMGRETEQTLFQRRLTNGQQVHEKKLNITNHQGNANQKHNEI